MNVKNKHEGPMKELFGLEEEFVDNLPISKKKKEKFLVFLDLIINIAIIIVFVTVIRKFLISPFQVYGPSMCNTLNYINETCHKGFGEYIIVNKAIYQNFFGLRLSEPKRGDIVVFYPPNNKKDFFIKRVVGLPGEKVKIENGEVIIFNEKHKNGLKLSENYLKEKRSTFPFSAQKNATYEVPENKYFVLGDNRKESTDSRVCFGPPTSGSCERTKKYFLDLKDIEGKAWIVLWPFNKIRIVENPLYE